MYRNLNILVDQGLAKRVSLGGSLEHFDACTHPHYHLICEKCSGIFDIEMPLDSRLNSIVTQETGFTVTGHQLHFYGICPNCKNN